MLDYSAQQAELGKTIGDDFREGKITLPVILAFRRGDEDEREFWRRTLEDLEPERGRSRRTRSSCMERHGALKDTVARARHYGAIARDALGIFPDCAEKRALIEVVRFLHRTRVTERPAPAALRGRAPDEAIDRALRSECSSAW